jgi:hypothetical protein
MIKFFIFYNLKSFNTINININKFFKYKIKHTAHNNKIIGSNVAI